MTTPFPAEALAEAEAAAAKRFEGDPVDLPFVTVDPPGARDLDQALHIAPVGDGHRVSYAIADLTRFVMPGGALDAAVWERGVTVYDDPDGPVPLHPPVLSAGAASLLPEEVRPAVLWSLDLDARGALAQVDVRRALVRSVGQHTYEDVPGDVLAMMEAVGKRREALERDRGGISLPIPEQEIDGDGTLRYRAPLPSEGYNAQLSLLTGMAAADLMLRGAAGLLRTLPAAEPEALERLRRVAAALGREWGSEVEYGAFIRSLDPFDGRDAAILRAATRVLRGAGYLAFDDDGVAPKDGRHSAIAEEYAHVTAPLRRLADRYATECALAAFAGEPVPAWVRDRLEALPAVMEAAERHANEAERTAVDRAEARTLAGRVGEAFEAVVIADGIVQLRDPAVRARCDGEPPLGQEIRARLLEADPATGTVRFGA
ncbi:MAG: RNB domain-containing ribonuclease [Solirubrobacteraceae bacterium]